MRSPAIHRALALALFLASSSAHAEDDPRVLHEQAEERFNAGDALLAAELWERVLVIAGPDKAWRANYNLGLCYQKLGEATLAVERFDAFITRVKAQTEVPEALATLADDATTRAAAIRASHGGVKLPASPGVKVRIDGGAVRDVGFTAYLPPGAHTVEVIGPRGSRSEQVELFAGREVAIDTSSPERPVPIPTPLPQPRPEDEGPEFPTVLFFVGLGATAVSFVFPGVMYAMAEDSRDEAEALGAGHTGYATARDGFEDDRTAYQLSYLLPAGLGAVTAAIGIVGAVRMATWTPATQTPAGETSMGLTFTPGGCAVWLSGGF
jgi:hypothetical protein